MQISRVTDFAAGAAGSKPNSDRFMRCQARLIHVVVPQQREEYACPDDQPFAGSGTGREPMNQIIYFVGLVVIVMFVLGYLGLR